MSIGFLIFSQAGRRRSPPGPRELEHRGDTALAAGQRDAGLHADAGGGAGVADSLELRFF